MAKRIIFIHGRAQKPNKENLKKLWYQAVQFGLNRSFGSEAETAFKSVKKDFVYFGDLSNELLKLPDEDPTSRFKALEVLQSYSSSQFTRKKYKEVSEAGFIKEALADTFSALFGSIGLAEPLITKVAPDMAHYWNEGSYFGSNVRHRLTPCLKRAFDRNDQIMLVSHSLGTMISFDNLWKFSHYGEYRSDYGSNKKIDLFVTMGSPLGDENVKARLKGRNSKGAFKYPTNISRWYNFSAEDDYISHDSRLKNDYKEMMELGLLGEPIKDCHPIYNLNVRNGKSNPHSSIGYLINPKFSELLNEWLNS